MKCNKCGYQRPINLDTWHLFNDGDDKSEGKCGKCRLPDTHFSVEQDLRMYKYLMEKVTQTRGNEKVEVVKYIMVITNAYYKYYLVLVLPKLISYF